MDQEIKVSLFECDFSALLAPFDKRMLKLKLRPKSNAIAKSVSEEQDEPVKVERRRVQAVVIQVGFHVAGVWHVLDLGRSVGDWRRRRGRDERGLLNRCCR